MVTATLSALSGQPNWRRNKPATASRKAAGAAGDSIAEHVLEFRAGWLSLELHALAPGHPLRGLHVLATAEHMDLLRLWRVHRPRLSGSRRRNAAAAAQARPIRTILVDGICRCHGPYSVWLEAQLDPRELPLGLI